MGKDGARYGNDECVSVCDNVLDVPAGQWIPACAGMTTNEGAGPDTGMTKRKTGADTGITKSGCRARYGNDDERECVCDNVLDVPAGQWIPARKSPTKIYNFCGV